MKVEVAPASLLPVLVSMLKIGLSVVVVPMLQAKSSLLAIVEVAADW